MDVSALDLWRDLGRQPKVIYAVVAKGRPQPTEENPKPRMKTYIRVCLDRKHAESLRDRLRSFEQWPNGDSPETASLVCSQLNWEELDA